jgi:hypothetical protein
MINTPTIVGRTIAKIHDFDEGSEIIQIQNKNRLVKISRLD